MSAMSNSKNALTGKQIEECRANGWDMYRDADGSIHRALCCFVRTDDVGNCVQDDEGFVILMTSEEISAMNAKMAAKQRRKNEYNREIDGSGETVGSAHGVQQI